MARVRSLREIKQNTTEVWPSRDISKNQQILQHSLYRLVQKSWADTQVVFPDHWRNTHQTTGSPRCTVPARAAGYSLATLWQTAGPASPQHCRSLSPTRTFICRGRSHHWDISWEHLQLGRKGNADSFTSSPGDFILCKKQNPTVLATPD